MRDDQHFRTSSWCANGTCLGVSIGDDTVQIRRLPRTDTAVEVSREEWAAFVAGVKNGEFDLD